MTDLRQAAQQALEALESAEDQLAKPYSTQAQHAITALRAALAEPEEYAAQNPLGGPAKVFDAMADAIRAGDNYHATLRHYGFAEVKALAEPEQIGNARCPRCWEPITAPTPRKPLTDEEISSLWDGHVVPVFGKNGINPIVFARAIERAHGIKEQEP